MFYFWRGATAALVPGFLCQSGRRRPENVSILSSLLPALNSIKTMFLIEFSRSEVDLSSLRNENKYHYPGIQNMYKKVNVEF